MNSDSMHLIFLYGWFLSGLYSAKWLAAANIPALKKFRSLWAFLAFFCGPLGLGYFYWLKNRDELLKKIAFWKQKARPGNTKHLDLIFLDSRGRDMFAGNNADSDVVEYVKKTIYDAIVRNSSDIFVDPKDSAYLLRFRVDGLIRIYDTLLEDRALAVVSMIKVAAGMDIAEKRRPQDGSFSVSSNGLSTSFRVASVGVYGGEKITIRVIASENSQRSLDKIGLSPEQLNVVRKGIRMPSGMILMCGPTGSGKTSTLYSMLGSIDYNMKNVISIEDPIERVIPRISQMEVNTKADISFASLLRNSLRQNPDIICVGEIRDEETAEIATHAAQTGHLIIATLHSNDNIGTLVRLMDLGVPLRSIAASLHLIISQRLIRKLCPHCKKPAVLSPDQQTFCDNYNIPPNTIQAAVGCPRCDSTGYVGRKAIFELLIMDAGLRSVMEAPDTSITAIQEYINQNQGDYAISGMAMQAVLDGETSWEEFERVAINI